MRREDGALKAALSCGIWIVMGIIHSFIHSVNLQLLSWAWTPLTEP